MSLLTEVDAFYLEHRACDDLDTGIDWPIVGSRARAGPALARRAEESDALAVNG